MRHGPDTASLGALDRAIVACDRCPRLREHCAATAVERRAAYRGEEYWGRPVPNFGDPDATLLLVGLAPGAHGANRTGRMFTGDRSGDFLFSALHATGSANQPTSRHTGDGLRLFGTLITAVEHCAPPGNKPGRDEIAACRPFLDATFVSLAALRCVVALGGIAFDASVDALARHQGVRVGPRPRFAHGVRAEVGRITLLGSYHPSQQNTFTGRLTMPMLVDVLGLARTVADGADSGK